MKSKKVIFKAEGANRGLVHVYLVNDGKNIFYEVMRDRKKVQGVCRYWTLNKAIEAAVELCERDIIAAKEGGLL